MAGFLSLIGGNSSGAGYLHEEQASVYLLPLDDEGNVQVAAPGAITTGAQSPARSFQFWPAEISDSEGVNYATKQIPGGNLPFYQWVSGGEHNVTFSAVFARDIWVTGVNGLLEGAGVPEDKHNVDVGAACKYLRSLKAPEYRQGEDFARPPPLMYLVTPNVPIGRDMDDRMLCLMTQCDITWKRSFPDGTPRLAEVSLGFAETVQAPRQTAWYGRGDFPVAPNRYTYTRGQT